MANTTKYYLVSAICDGGFYVLNIESSHASVQGCREAISMSDALDRLYGESEEEERVYAEWLVLASDAQIMRTLERGQTCVPESLMDMIRADSDILSA